MCFMRRAKESIRVLFAERRWERKTCSVKHPHADSHNPVKRFWLFAVLAATVLLRLPGIEWGLPPTTPEVAASGLRSSYAFDERLILEAVAKADMKRLDFDPRDHHWGTLHLDLVLLALDGAEAAGFFRSPWRMAYHDMIQGDFVRVYVVGRTVAIFAALFTVWLLFRFSYGAFAAMLVAVSPSHVLQSDQVRVDVTMTAFVILTLLFGLRIHEPDKNLSATDATAWPQFLVLGIAAGLAISAKYSALTAVAPIALAALWLKRFPLRGILAVAGGGLLGFLASWPYFLSRLFAPLEISKGLRGYVEAYGNAPPPQFLISAGKLLELHGLNIVRFSMGLPAFLLAAGGIAWMLRRRSRSDWTILAAIGGSVVILFPLHWPLVRYDLPLTALLGLCAGAALERFPKRWRGWLTAVALAMPLAGSIAQIKFMTSTHPANLALQRVLEIVPPGNVIARLVPEEPPLDEKIYPMAQNIVLDDLTANPPAWVLMTDLPEVPYPEATLALLRSSYEEVADFGSHRIFAWSTFGEAGAPQDWKYTHPHFVLYRKRS